MDDIAASLYVDLDDTGPGSQVARSTLEERSDRAERNGNADRNINHEQEEEFSLEADGALNL